MTVPNSNQIETLKKLCSILNENKISFTLGGSGLLYFKGIVKSFKDWDLVLYCSESEIQAALFHLNIQEQVCTPPYLSRFFYRLDWNGVSFDLMGHFGVENFGERIQIPYVVTSYHDNIPLGDLTDWMTSYRLMGRLEKFEMIRKYLQK